MTVVWPKPFTKNLTAYSRDDHHAADAATHVAICPNWMMIRMLSAKACLMAESTGRMWRLRTSSWVGRSIGAQHYYAWIEHGGDDRVRRIERVMTPQDIARLNKARREMGLQLTDYKPGEWCDGFDSLEDAISAGMVVWDALNSPGDSLVHFTSVTAIVREDGTLLCGPEGNEYVYPSGVYVPERAAVVTRTAHGWRFVELEAD
jgi:hypothetical protein